MITWRLWQALHHPPLNHPVFQRTVGVDRLSRRLLTFAEGLAPATLATGLLLCGAMWFLPQVVLFAQLFIVWGTAPLAFIMVNGTLFGGIWAATIARTIAAEYDRKRYDLLCLAPGGTLLVNWALCTACLYRNQLFQFIHTQRNTIIYQVIVPASVLLVIGFTLSSETRGQALIVHIVGYSCVIIAFLSDYIYSMVLCSVTGMLAPALARNSLNAPLWGMGSFLWVQALTYTIIAVIALVILPLLYAAVQAYGVYADISIAILRLLVFFIARELVIRYLWHVLRKRLNLEGIELEALLLRPV